ELILKYFSPVKREEFDKDNKSHKWMTSTEIMEFLLELHPKLNLYTRTIGKALQRLGFQQNKNTAIRSYLIGFNKIDSISYLKGDK
ncbi:MAG: hypothetical protein KDK36_12820, partial [Leptospiraceae bacterium]|nr:hypothetical protein [Leptospiraceae bacterium]